MSTDNYLSYLKHTTIGRSCGVRVGCAAQLGRHKRSNESGARSVDVLVRG
jgi:hypothetical protein